MILLAVVLAGLLTAAIQFSSRPEGANIDEESLLIRATEVQRYASELERAVLFIVQENGRSEADIRFAHPQAHSDYGTVTDEPERQIFAREGGGAVYREPPEGIQTTASAWEFYAGTRIPQVGSSRADLVAVLPHVTEQFCQKINDLNNQTGTPMESGAGCIHDTSIRFGSTTLYVDSGTNVMDESAGSFSSKPALQACVDCDPLGTHEYHFYHVLLAR